MSTAVTTGRAPVNGIELYYEIRGDGDPLVMLHGALSSMENFGGNLDALARHRRVISVDLRAHGHSSDGDGPLTAEAMADDVAGLLDHLTLGQADVLGYSMGGGVAVQLGLRHRERVRRLVVVSKAFRRSAYFPEVIAGFGALGPHLVELMKPSPVYAHYATVSPRPDFAGLLGKIAAQAQVDYDWTPLVGQLPPTLLVAGDADGMHLAHIVEVFTLLGGSQRDPGWDGSAGRTSSALAILPNVDHYDMATSPALPAAVEAFLSR